MKFEIKKKEKMEIFASSFHSDPLFIFGKLGRRGAEKGVHFTAGFVHEKMEKRRNEEGEGEKRRLVSFYILSVFS